MRPPLVQLLAAMDQDRRRSGGPLPARHRALLGERGTRPSRTARVLAATLRVMRRERHSLTSYPCRLPDGRIGRTAVVQRAGEWTLVCQVA